MLEQLIKEYNINVIYEELGKINGYYNSFDNTKYIHINNELSIRKQNFVIAHEIGHIVLHKEYNLYFFRNHTYYYTDKFELEADRFAINLLISDSDIEEYKDKTISELSKIFGYEERLIELKLKSMQRSF